MLQTTAEYTFFSAELLSEHGIFTETDHILDDET